MSININAIFSLNVLMGRGYDATPAIALIVKKTAYLFNTPPLIYRLCIQNAIKIKTIKGIFLTSDQPYASGCIQSFYESIKTCTAKYQIFAPKTLESYMCHNEAIVDQDTIYSLISPTPEYKSQEVNVTSIEMSNSLSYIVNIDLNDIKFNQAKMKELNIPPGSWINKVKNEGEVDINGIHITRKDIFCIEHSHYKLLFLDVQSKPDLEQIPSIDELNSFDLIIHFTPPELLDAEYFSHFPIECKPLNFCFLNDPIICLKQSNEFYENFTKIDSSLFPPLPKGHITSHPNLPPNFQSLFSGLTLNSGNQFKLKKEPAVPVKPCNFPRFDAFALTIIGSSGAYECPAKGCSGYLLQTREGFIIIDCGSGYLQQLCRRYGPENLEVIMKNLKCVWISHCHFDHLLGIYDILLYRRRVSGSELLVLCDPISQHEIEEKEEIFGKGDKKFFNLVFNDRTNRVFACGVCIESIETTHCEFSMGCVFTFPNGFRIAYTGDMLNDHKFDRLVGHCDVLICEATYPESKSDRCSVYLHMSNNQAEDLQSSLGASYLIMVHTSNNYSPDEFVTKNYNSIYGFDYLCITDLNIKDVFSVISKVHVKP